MISDYRQSILYICPDCTEVTEGSISVFDIPRNRTLELKCSDTMCNSPLVSIKFYKDKYKISVECPVCDETHTFNISAKTLWTKEFFILKCPTVGLGIFFAGKDAERLVREYQAQNDLAAGMLAEEDFDEDELDLLFEIFETINELAQNKAISCSCGSDNISIMLNAEGISLVCRACKKKANFEICDDFLNKLINENYLLI